MSSEDTFPDITPGPRPFEERIVMLFEIAGGRAPRTAIWIVGHLAHSGEDYPTQMIRLYNLFLTSRLGQAEIQQSTFYRYLELLIEHDQDILVEENPADLTKQEQGEGGKFPKNHYRVAEDFRTGWAFEEPPEEPVLFDELVEPIPDGLLDPWGD